jgi:hypothetical protein
LPPLADRPAAKSITVAALAGACSVKLNVAVPALNVPGAVCTTSSPPTTRVPAPAISVPPVTAALKPARTPAPPEMLTVYVALAPGISIAGPVRVTAGAAPPTWQVLQVAPACMPE